MSEERNNVSAATDEDSKTQDPSGAKAVSSSRPDTHMSSQDEYEDDFDSDNEYEDPFVYSEDESELSLTDNYFNPQHGDDSFYGSFDHDRPSPPMKPHQSRYPPILEDSPVTQSTHLLTSPLHHMTNAPGHTKRRHRKKKRRQMGQRERAVHRIRGERQSSTEYHGKPWSVLFLIQLLFVVACAVRYGWTLLKPTQMTLDDDNTLNRNQRFLGSSRKSDNQTALDMATTVPKALFNVTSSVNATVAYSKDLKNLQDDDFIQSEHSSQSSGLVKDSGLVNNRASGVSQATTPISSGSSSASNPTLFRIDYQNVISIFSISGFYAIVTSYLSFGFMLSVARSVIPIVLIFTILFAFCWGLFGLTVFPHSMIAILGFGCLGLALGYAKVSWNRIPFCSINLYTAMCALRDTSGILFVGIGSLVVTFVWLMFWLVALIGIFNTSNANECRQSRIDCRTHLVLEEDRYFELAILVFSLFWTCIVIKNIVRTTIAGACGGWWFGVHGQPQGWGCFDSIIWNHLVRSCTYSLGSICLGSLLELPIHAISLLGGTICFCTTNRSSEKRADFSRTKPIGREQSLNSVSSWENEGDGFFKVLSNRIHSCNRWCYIYIGKSII
jgi:hypothetical protein